MAFLTEALMVLFYDFEGDTADHDDWHSREHFRERLSVPGFLRATRWVSGADSPRFMVTYEVASVDVATSVGYLERLDNPTPWTTRMMPRFRGMTRGFCNVIAGSGLGLGGAAMAVRFLPKEGSDTRLERWLVGEALPAAASLRGVTGVHLLRPSPPPPMTREQALRGPDRAMPWVVIATGYSIDALANTEDAALTSEAFRANGATDEVLVGHYALHHTAIAGDAAAAD